MSKWSESGPRDFLYRAVVKSRVELERRTGKRGSSIKRAAAKPGRANLSWLAAVYGSDKGATAHRYVDLYERHLSSNRHRVRRVLEIGVYRGASLQMWRDYFPNAQIYGIDIQASSVSGSRIHTIKGDQSDPALLARVRDLGPFDLIVDDGSHRARELVASFTGLFAELMPDGYYVIEDMHTSYMGEYGGGAPGAPDTSVALAQGLIDAVNREHVAVSHPEIASTMPHVSALHVYPKIAFVQRGRQHS